MDRSHHIRYYKVDSKRQCYRLYHTSGIKERKRSCVRKEEYQRFRGETWWQRKELREGNGEGDYDET